MALFECPRCGTKLAYASKEHPCKGGKSSDGRRDEIAHPVVATAKPPRSSERPKAAASGHLPRAGIASRPSEDNPVAKATKGKAGTAGVKGPVRRSTAGTGLQVGVAGADQPDGGERPPTNLVPDTTPQSRRGRPKKGEQRDKPWETEGISKAQWYRNKKKK